MMRIFEGMNYRKDFVTIKSANLVFFDILTAISKLE